MQNLRNTDKNQRLGAEPEKRDSGWTEGNSGVLGKKLMAKTIRSAIYVWEQ